MSEEVKNVSATVKWFKADKGFGFVRFPDGSADAFVHSSILAPLGLTALPEGAALVCDVAENPKGRQVTAIHNVTPPEAPPPPKPARARGRQRGVDGAPVPPGMEPQPPMPGLPGIGEPPRRERRVPQPRAVVTAEPAYGTVRWYNLESQSGLIDPWDDSELVFFDRATLRQSGLEIVADGEDVRYVAYDSDQGPVAQRVELA